MGNKHSRSSPESAQRSRTQFLPTPNADSQNTSATQRAAAAPVNMPPHLASQYSTNSRANRTPNGGAPSGGSAGAPQVEPPSEQTPHPPEAAPSPAQSQPAAPFQNNSRCVQEGQMLKIASTIEASTVSYSPSTQLLTFYITSLAPSLTYEIHTGVKEFVRGGNVFYMPNKPKMEPTRILIEGPQENRKIAVKLDISKLEEKEKVFNKHYPRQMPCVIVLRYRTTEMRKKESVDSPPATGCGGRSIAEVNEKQERSDGNAGEDATAEMEEVTVEHTEHTAVDLAERPKRRVISQIVTTGDSAYVVENLYGAGHENATGGGVGTELMVGATIVPHDGEMEEEGICVICLTNPKDIAVMPCRHMCMCKGCGDQLLKHKPVCPVCRAPISTLLHMPSFANGNSK